MIRQYDPADCETLIAIWRAASEVAHPFLDEPFLAQETENFRNIYLPNTETWVMEHDGVPIGFIAMMGSEIGGLFLLPSWHGKGFGKAMLAHVRAQKGELSVEVFEGNAIGRRFYDGAGFVETSRYFHEATGQQVIRMILR